MRQAGPLSRAGSVFRDLCEIHGNTWKSFSLASRDPGNMKPGFRLAGMKIYHVITMAGPDRLTGPTLSRH